MKRQIKACIYILMAISLVVCGYIGVQRIKVEADYKNVEVAVRYSDILKISIEEEIPLEQVLIQFKEMGATTLLVKENTVSAPSDTDYYSYKGLGKVGVVNGYILKLAYPENENIKFQSTYVITENKEIADDIYENYAIKDIRLETFRIDDRYFLDVGDHLGALKVIGVGFDTENLNKAADLGYSISLQIKNFNLEDEAAMDSALQYLMFEIKDLNNVNTIYFSDSKVPLANSKRFADFINEGYQLGFIEFTSNKQQGFNTLAKASSQDGTDYKVVRLHALEDGKVNKFSIPQLMDRYDLALKERNNRVFLFKMPNSGQIEEDIAYMKEAITTFVTKAEQDGYTVTSEVGGYNLYQASGILLLVAGLASIMVFILLLGEVGLEKVGYGLGVLGIIGYAVLLKWRSDLACQMIALFGTIVFPTYAMIRGIRVEPRTIKQSILALLKICAISAGGILTIIGTLSKTNFALGLDVFAGVKVATTMPIVLVLLFLIYKQHHLDFKFYKSLLERKISYGAVLVIAAIAGVLSVYVMRSGNSGSISSLEVAFRQFLDNTLGVRPRTKEILIGYPILLAFLYYGYKPPYLVFMALATMGPISLINTYAHIHTPLLISFIRSGYGIIIGIVVGLILIKVIKILAKVIKKWQTQLK